MKLFAGIILFSLAICFGDSPDPEGLLEKARLVLAKPGGNQEAISLLRKANAIWAKSASDDPAYAESLDFLALLIRFSSTRTSESSSLPPDTWRTNAAPLVQRALQIREAHADTKLSDLALALELQADVLGRADAGAPYWKRAAEIRAGIVAAVLPEQSLMTGPALKIGGEVSAPVLIHKVEPEYSETAREAKYQGSPRLSIVVDAKGVPGEFKLVQGCGYGLDEMAVAAVRQWRFRPSMKNGEPVASVAQVEVNYRLMSTPNGVTPPRPSSGGQTLNSTTLVLAPGGSAPWSGTLRAPGYGKRLYSGQKIDGSRLRSPALLVMRISVGGGQANGSFDLLPSKSGEAAPYDPLEESSLAHAWGVNQRDDLMIASRISPGEVLYLGAEGSWSAPLATSNTFTVTVSTFYLEPTPVDLSTAAAALEEQLKREPENAGARVQIISFYTSGKGIEDPSYAKQVRARHILWLARNHPESPLLGLPLCHLNRAGEPLSDEATYQEGRSIWQDQIAKSAGKLSVTDHAMSYFLINDPLQAESLILDLIQKDRKYEILLGRLYGFGVLGVDALDYQTGEPSHRSDLAAASEFAVRARATLDSCSEAFLCASAARVIAKANARLSPTAPIFKTLGEKYWARAIHFDPDLASVSSGVFRVGGDVSPPVLIHKVEPKYSEEARKAKYSGTVLLSIVVDSNGLPRDIHVIRPLGLGLDEKAIAAVAKWRFRPGMKDGHPVATQNQVEVNFRLL